jgi:hypothetical protein
MLRQERHLEAGALMLTDEEIKARLQGAFMPLRCITKDRDYKHRLCFAVFDHDGQGIFKSADLVRRHLKDEGYLQDVIHQTRSQVQAKGFTLI